MKAWLHKLALSGTLAFIAGVAIAANSAVVTETPGATTTVYRGTTTIGVVLDYAACKALATSDAITRAPGTYSYGCQDARDKLSIKITAGPPPAPVDATCQDNGWQTASTSACVNNVQTIIQTRSWTTLTPASNGGQACPAAQTRTITQACTSVPPPNPGAVQRPSYNTGTGFFVLGGKVYNPAGTEFRLRGVNRVHFDYGPQPALSKTAANTTRFFMYRLALGAQTYLNTAVNEAIAYKEVPIVTMAQFPDETDTAGNSDVAKFTAGVDWWVANAAVFAPLNKNSMINIANEWGPSNSTIWRDSYITAISRMRAAGYTLPLMIDAGGFGQDMNDLLKYSAAVFNSDPQKNIVFSFHVYGNTINLTATVSSSSTVGGNTVVTINDNSATHPFCPGFPGNSWTPFATYMVGGVSRAAPNSNNVGGVRGAWTVTLSGTTPVSSGVSITPHDTSGGGMNYQYLMQDLAALSANGAAYIIGEFGPGRNIGPSPTVVTPGQVITAAEANGLGWLAWAWDDNNLPNSQSDDNSFSLSHDAAVYNTSADLTIFGRDVVENHSYGLKVLARPSTIF